MSRQYTDDALAELARPVESHALEALQRGDLELLRRHLDEMARGHDGLDSLSAHAIARKAGKLRVDRGEVAVRAALTRIGAPLMTTWAAQWRAGEVREAVSDLVAVFRYQGDAGLQPLQETDDAACLERAPCGTGGRLERQRLPEHHPTAYGGWSDATSSFCQACRGCQQGSNEAAGLPAWTTEKGLDGRCRLRFDKGAQRGQALFSAEERRLLTQTQVQQARERLDTGDTAIAALLEGQRKECRPWHDFAVVWLAHFYAVALEVGEPDYLDETLTQTYQPAFVAGFARYGAMDDDALVHEIARTWNYHCADFRLHEEDERFVFTLDPCGSGGRLLRGQMWRDLFRYGRPLSPTMPEPHPINFNRHNAPTYCTHRAASNRAQQRAGMPCRTFVYKKDADRLRIDSALFTQLGLAPAGSAPSPTPTGSPL